MSSTQNRDGEILRLIYENDGVLAKRHLKNIFWPNSSYRAMEIRLSKLFHEAYLSWPSNNQYKTHPIPEPICWLEWRGALYVAGETGIRVDKPKNNNEYQMRKLQNNLKENGVRWVREPPWSVLGHNIAVIDFKLSVSNLMNNLRVFNNMKSYGYGDKTNLLI